MIKKNKVYRIKGESKYFKEKYGTSNPEIRIEDTDKEVFGGSWGDQQGNPACMLFGIRSGMENPKEGGILSDVWYGKVQGFGELVYGCELEEVVNG